jgi:cytosine/adenosine deaminase-related metal-dependent hydrolase
MADVYSTLVYGVRGSDVANVWVDGVERVRNGRVRGVKLPSLRAEAERHASRIAAETARA